MLAVDAGGNVYGTTQQGAKYGGGTIFKLSAARKLTILHAFDAAAGDGSGPLQGLVRSGTGALYGTAAGDAISTNGSVFEGDRDRRLSNPLRVREQRRRALPLFGRRGR